MDNKELEKKNIEAINKIAAATEKYNELIKGYGYDLPEVTTYTTQSQTRVSVYSKHGSEKIPQYATNGSSGMDLRAYLEEPVTLQPMERKLIPTGIHVDLPIGYEFQIRPRSGTSFKRGLTVPNTPGTIDADYTDEIYVPIVNIDTKPQTIEPNERIAQMVLAKVEKCIWNECDSKEEFNSGDRTGGFGSTGTH